MYKQAYQVLNTLMLTWDYFPFEDSFLLREDVLQYPWSWAYKWLGASHPGFWDLNPCKKNMLSYPLSLLSSPTPSLFTFVLVLSAGESNSGLHAFRASVLPTEPFPCPLSHSSARSVLSLRLNPPLLDPYIGLSLLLCFLMNSAFTILQVHHSTLILQLTGLALPVCLYRSWVCHLYPSLCTLTSVTQVAHSTC